MVGLKLYVREHNVTGDLSLKKLQEVTESAIQSITPTDWDGYVTHVKKLEEDFWKKDGLLEDVVDNFVISVGGIESSDEESDSESEDSQRGWELARPLSD